MLSMSIVDDIGAVLVVAIRYGNSLHWEVLALAVVGIIIIRGMGLLGIRNVAIYSLAGGVLWILMDVSGIHATVTGVILGLMTPTEKWVSGERLHAILANVVAYPPVSIGSRIPKDGRHCKWQKLQHMERCLRLKGW